MGNRAVITAAPYSDDNIGIYVHWNGGQESIEGFIRAAKELGFRDPLQDSYGWARLTQLIANFFRDTLSIGVDVCRNLDTDNMDNGTWLLGPGWTIEGCLHGRLADSVDEEKAESVKSLALRRQAAVEGVE